MQHRNADGSSSSQANAAIHVFRKYIIVSLSTEQWPRLSCSSKKEVHCILPIQCIRNQKLWKRECETVSVATHVRFLIAYRLQESMKAQTVICNLGAWCVWVVNATPRPLYPGQETGTHCTGRWVSPRVGLGRRGISRPPPGFDPHTLQSLTSCYNNYAIRPNWWGDA